MGQGVVKPLITPESLLWVGVREEGAFPKCGGEENPPPFWGPPPADF